MSLTSTMQHCADSRETVRWLNSTQVYGITVIRSPARKKQAQRPRFSLNFMICCKGLMHTKCEQSVSKSNIPCNKYHTEIPRPALPSSAYCMSVISMTCDLYLTSQKQWDMQLYTHSHQLRHAFKKTTRKNAFMFWSE